MNNKKKNFISILVTNYNKERFLNKSINSCLKQKFKKKEIIIFDDCSNDKSLKYLKNFQILNWLKTKKKDIYQDLLIKFMACQKYLKNRKVRLFFYLIVMMNIK